MCDSGKYHEAIYDGYGIYLTKVCEDCRKESLKGFRADIFERYEHDEPLDPED
jgi:hypothetical protein